MKKVYKEGVWHTTIQYKSTMFISTILLASTTFASVRASPLAMAQDCVEKKNHVLGATYFITNRPAQTIIISTIHANGSLSFAKEVPTGGAGGFAVFGSGVDVLFSQDSVLVSDNVFPLTFQLLVHSPYPALFASLGGRQL